MADQGLLDAMLLELGKSQLTHELLVTLLAEVSAIANAVLLPPYRLMLTTRSLCHFLCYSP